MKLKLSLLVLCTATLLSCSEKDPEPEPTLVQSVSTHYDKTHQFDVKQGNAAATDFQWSSSDTQVGTINAAGLFTAKRVGKTTVKAEKNGKVLKSEVTVSPYFNTFTEPVSDFGLSMTAVKAKEFRNLLEQNSDALAYAGENTKIRGLIYIFGDSKLEASAVLFANTAEMVSEALTFYGERYNLVGADASGRYYQNGKVGIALGVDETLGFIAIYAEYDGTATVGAVKAAVRSARTEMRLMPQQ